MISSILEMQRLNRIDVPAIFGPRFDTLQIFYSSPEYYTECKYTELQTSKTNMANEQVQPMLPVLMDYPRTNITYKIKTDDFMPYSDCEDCFWTGYFTSRASLKRLERVASAVLMSARQLDSLVDHHQQQRNEFSCPSALHTLEDASGVAQHHDGVSGTSKQHVADDYAARLHDGIHQVAACASRKLRRLFLGPNASQYWQDLRYCQLLNETKCDISQVNENRVVPFCIVCEWLGREADRLILLTDCSISFSVMTGSDFSKWNGCIRRCLQSFGTDKVHHYSFASFKQGNIQC